MRLLDDVRHDDQQIDETRAALIAWQQAAPGRIAELEHAVAGKLIDIAKGTLQEKDLDGSIMEVVRLRMMLDGPTALALRQLDADKAQLQILLQRGAQHVQARRERVQFAQMVNRAIMMRDLSTDDRAALMRLAQTDDNKRLVDELFEGLRRFKASGAPMRMPPLPIPTDEEPIWV